MTVTGWRGFFAVELNASRINSSINLWLSCHPHLYFAMKCCCWCIVKDTLLNFTYFGYYDRIFDVVMKLSKCFFIKLDFCHPVIVCSSVTCICFEYSMRKLLESFRNPLKMLEKLQETLRIFLKMSFRLLRKFLKIIRGILRNRVFISNLKITRNSYKLLIFFCLNNQKAN